MAKYTELQTRKLISSYGGVGSIIETTEGALKIKNFDWWKYFALINKGKIEIEDNEIIIDDRLLKRLQYFFPKLKNLVKVPANYSALYNASLPKNKEHIVNAEYFPKWMYCNNCGSFMHINDWYKRWQNAYNSKDINKINSSFTPPKCYKCYNKAVKNKERRKFYPLEQVRFILTASNGEIKDIPWEQWTNLSRPTQKEKDESVDKQLSNIIFNGKCCNKQDLKYIKDGKMSDFSGVRIQCKNPDCPTKGKQKSLAGLFGLRLFCEQVKDKEGNVVLDKKGEELKFCYKPVIRTSNSVYYPLITNSLYLPSIIIKKEIKEKIKTLYEDADFSQEQIQKKVNEKYKIQLSLSQIDEILIPENADFIKEIDYRLKEYLFLTTAESPDNNNLSYEEEKSDELIKFGISKLLKIKRLKLSSVQTGYSRQEPIDKDLYAEYSMDDFIKINQHSVKAKYTSSKGNKTEILPGVESFGEGIFIDFNADKLDNWFNEQSKNKKFNERIEIIKENALNSNFNLSDEKKKIVENPSYLSKFLFLHTFSHILIKEFEFLVGYPATSLSERLYINENDMQGILIYTIAGAEGSFGGLVSQANSEGQGIGGLNLAACYSCTLLPETSCEEFNSYLDRAMIIDTDFGYYSENFNTNEKKE